MWPPSTSRGIRRVFPVNSEDSKSSLFKSITVFMCHGQTFPLQCPPGSQILIPSAILGQQDALSTTGQSINASFLPCAASLNTPIASAPATSSHCMNLKDVTSPIKQLCEGKLSCSISPDQFTANESSCTHMKRHLLVKYICEPSPQAIKKEIVCLDTYLELKCGGRHPKDVIAVLKASLEANTQSDRCPVLPEMPKMSTVCPATIDVSPHLRGLCDRRRTCSVMPDPSMLPTNQPASCGKRHLRLTYACANPSIFENDTPAPADSPPRRTKHRQGQKKKLRREELAVSTLNRHTSPFESEPEYKTTFSSIRSEYVSGLHLPELEGPVLLPPHDLRDNVLTRSRQEDFESEYEWPRIPKKELPTTALKDSGEAEKSPSLHSIVLGVIVGLAALTAILITLVIIGFRNRKKKLINFGPRIPSGNLTNSPSKNKLSVSTSRHSFSDTHVQMSLVETIDRSSSKQNSTGSNYVYLQQQADQHLSYQCPMQHMSENAVFPGYAPHAQLSDIIWPLDDMPSTENLQGYPGKYQGDIPYALNTGHHDGFVTKSGPLFFKCPPTEGGSQAYAQLSYYQANDGKLTPKYLRHTSLGKPSSGTRSSPSTNRSVNGGNAFPVSRACDMTELVSSQTCSGNIAAYGYNVSHCTSMEVNSAFSGNGSIESDRFSVPVSSHPFSSPLASLNTVRPSSDLNCPPKTQPAHPKVEQCLPISMSAENPFPDQQWIGFDNSPNYPAVSAHDAKENLHLPSSDASKKTKSKILNGQTEEVTRSTESLNTCLIEPPESFKNAVQPKGGDLESTPPQMPPLKLQVACEQLMADSRPMGISCWNEVSIWNNQAAGIS
uniref:Protein eva-1 homolog C n=1 Tax=Schistocephalus solidus TaxID=70667 RepID=A0A0V0J772_SCHSO